MTEPEFDEDGYPTDDILDSIANWKGDLQSLFEFVQRAWRYSGMVQRDGLKWYFSTGGWSGNESLIGAMQNNLLLWALCWEKSERGGHFWFEIPVIGDKIEL